jgi:hypothetical protein
MAETMARSYPSKRAFKADEATLRAEGWRLQSVERGPAAGDATADMRPAPPGGHGSDVLDLLIIVVRVPWNAARLLLERRSRPYHAVYER